MALGRRAPEQAHFVRWSVYLPAGAALVLVALVGTRGVWPRPGVVGLLYDWSIPATRPAIQRLLETTWPASSPVNLGSFSVFGQGAVWEWLPLYLSYLGVGAGALSRIVLLCPIVLSGLGAMTFASATTTRQPGSLVRSGFWAFVLGLIYVLCGDGFFIMSDGAVSLMWFYVAVPWVLTIAAWTSRPSPRPWRLIVLGLTIGAVVTVSEFGWWLIPASVAVYLATCEETYGFVASTRRIVAVGGILAGAAVAVNLYWILHLTWVEVTQRGLVAAAAAGNSGLDYVKAAPTAVQALGLTGSVPNPTGSLVANSPAPLVTVLLPFTAVVLLLIVIIVRGPRRGELWLTGAYLTFAMLSAGEHVLGAIVAEVWGLAVMTPFRGFVHFELISAALLCGVFASAISEGPRGTRLVARGLAVVAVVGLGLPWLAGHVGGDGGSAGAPRLRTFDNSSRDVAKLALLEKSGVGVLDVPASGSVWIWSESGEGRHLWRPGGVNHTVEYSVARGLAALSAPPSDSPARVGWFETAPFVGDVSTASLARGMAAWDLGEVRVSRRDAAFIPQAGFEGPVPAIVSLRKFGKPYFIADGVTQDAFYFRLVGVTMGWAECLRDCGGRVIVSHSERSVLRLPSVDSVVRVAEVDTGDVSASCSGGSADIRSHVGEELVVAARCPTRRLSLGSRSHVLDEVFDVAAGFAILGWLAVMALWWRRGGRGYAVSAADGVEVGGGTLSGG